MAGNVQDKRRRGDSLFFTPVSPTEYPETSTSVRSPTRRKAKVQSNFGDRERTGSTTGILRSSSSPLLYHGEQVTFNRMQPLSPINQQFQGNSRAVANSSQFPSHSGHPRSSSQQQLHSAFYHSPSQPNPGSRHSFANPQSHHYHTTGPYSGSDAEDDNNETFEDRPLLVRTRSGSGNITSRRAYNNSSPILPFSPVIAAPVMARQTIHPPESENVPQETARSKSFLASNGSNPTLGKATNGQASSLQDKHPIVIGISGSSIQFSVNMDRISPLLFQCLCTLAAIPAMTETFALLMRVYNPQVNSGGNTRLDYIASVAWSILTAHQCFAFTTGLLTRWRHYYPLLSTLIRLVALQGICWPATFYTLRLLQYDGIERPLVCWSVIGTTTCITRSVQMWVTSNIDDWTREHDVSPQYGAHTVASIALGFGEKKVLGGNETEREDAAKKKQLHVPLPRTRSLSNGGQSKVRKWDWNEIIWKCAFPAGICYFFMAWALLLSRELYPSPECGSR